VAGRTEQQALRAFYEPIQQAVSYLTADVLTYIPTGPGSYALYFGGSRSSSAVRLFGDAQLALHLVQRVRLVTAEGQRGPFKVSTTSYNYSVADADTNQELVVFHWHPQGRQPEGHAAKLLACDPHMHVGSGATVDDRILNRHVPTERLSIEDVLLLAIEMGAVPREGWHNIIVAARDRFRKYRTWPNPSPQ